jgi:hypothetical protein
VDGFSRDRKERWRATELGVENLSKSDVDGRFLLVVKELDKVISVLPNGSIHSQHKANGRLL